MKKKTVIKAIVVVALAIFLLMYARNFRENHRISVENEVETSVTVISASFVILNFLFFRNRTKEISFCL